MAPITITAHPYQHAVTLTSDVGSFITLTWAAGINLGSLLFEKGHDAEPVLPSAKQYAPTAGQGRVRAWA